MQDAVKEFSERWARHLAMSTGSVMWGSDLKVAPRARYECYPGGRIIDWSILEERQMASKMRCWLLSSASNTLLEQFRQIATAPDGVDAGSLISKGDKLYLYYLGLVTPSHGKTFRLTPLGIAVMTEWVSKGEAS